MSVMKRRQLIALMKALRHHKRRSAFLGEIG
jgi:hypothetical protein